MKKAIKLQIVSPMFKVIGVFIMVVGAGMALWRCGFLLGSVAADGVVVADSFGNGSHLVIDFTTASGEHRSFLQDGFIFGRYPGQRVRVLYHPEDPGSGPCLASFDALWGVVLMVFAFGGAFYLSGRFVVHWLYD